MSIENRERRHTAMRPLARRATPRDARGDDAPSISGYAAVFYDGTQETQYQLYDDLAERIAHGAFDDALRDDDVRALFNHDPNCVLGRTTAGTLRLRVDRTGLKYEIDPPDTSIGRDLLASIRRGDVTGSSFSFIPISVSWTEEKGMTIRTIKAAQLFDVGPVTFPAYEATTANSRREYFAQDPVPRLD